MTNKEVENEIQRLIDLVDRGYKHKRLSSQRLIILVALYLIAFAIAIRVLILLVVSFAPFVTPEIYVSTSLSFIVIYITVFFAMTSELSKFPIEMKPEEVIQWNYKKLKKCCKEEPLLLSLITMKNKQPRLCLSKLDKSLLDPQRLMERLYE